MMGGVQKLPDTMEAASRTFPESTIARAVARQFLS